MQILDDQNLQKKRDVVDTIMKEDGVKNMLVHEEEKDKENLAFLLYF